MKSKLFCAYESPTSSALLRAAAQGVLMERGYAYLVKSDWGPDYPGE